MLDNNTSNHLTACKKKKRKKERKKEKRALAHLEIMLPTNYSLYIYITGFGIKYPTRVDML